MKLKRFYDHVNRPFDCSLAVGCQRSNSFTTNGACVVANCNDCYKKNTIALAGIFSHVTDQSGPLIVVIVTSPPPPVCQFNIT